MFGQVGRCTKKKKGSSMSWVQEQGLPSRKPPEPAQHAGKGFGHHHTLEGILRIAFGRAAEGRRAQNHGEVGFDSPPHLLRGGFKGRIPQKH